MFDFTGFKAVWAKNPTLCHITNSVSFLMEVVEPAVVTIVEEQNHREDPDIKSFIREERSHYSVHTRFNKQIKEEYKGHSFFMAIVSTIWNLVERMNSKWKIGCVYAFEAFALSSAYWVANRKADIFEESVPVVKEMFVWHFEEEFGHKEVAYNLSEDSELKFWHKLFGLIIVWLSVGWIVITHGVSGAIMNRSILTPFVLVWEGLKFVWDVLPENVLCLTSLWHPNKYLLPDLT